jgi:hypothetical protein
MGCVSWPDDIEANAYGRPLNQAPEAGAQANPPDAGVPPPDAAADPPPTLAPSPCPTQDFTWNSGASSCTASSGDALAPGASRDIVDSTVSDTGKVTITCINGALVPSNVICEPPKTFDVSGPTGCVHGYCDAASTAGCGIPDPKRATDICVLKGYADQISFTKAPGTNSSQCNANGTACYQSANACNVILTSVTCRH